MLLPLFFGTAKNDPYLEFCFDDKVPFFSWHEEDSN